VDKKTDNGPWLPVEIKCPYFWMNTKNLNDAVEDAIIKWPYGQPNAFIQAMCYAVMNNAPEFWTAFYYTDDEFYALVLHHFKTTQQMHSEVKTAVVKMCYSLREPQKAYRVPTERKNAILDLMEKTHQGMKFIRGEDCYSLQE
jgi:hypothetical protein